MNSIDIKDFYNDFSGKVLLNDFKHLNRRQIAIMELCDRFIPKGSRILEIGCGVGIIAKHLQKRAAEIISVDIGSMNISIAREYAVSPKNKFRVLDISNDAELHDLGMFDAVLLPDVIEHIPKEEHKQIFSNIENILLPNGFVLITCPSPEYQNYLKKNKPEAVQVVDETVTLPDILAATNLKPLYFSVKDIWLENTYLHIVLRNAVEYRPNVVRLSLFAELSYRIKNYWWRSKNKIFLKKIKNDL